jgi:hypothetical protein
MLPRVDPPVIAALVAATASLVVAIVNAVTGQRRETRIKKLEQEFEAEKVLNRYRGPLVSAAADLQERLDNIINPDRQFLAAYGRKRSPRREDAVRSTLYRVAQYFCWTEILRRDIQFLNFRRPEQRRAVTELFKDVGDTFGDDRYGTVFMVWFEEQRAIGERMIERDGETSTCVGYATFVENYDRVYARWLRRFEEGLTHETASTSKRLVLLREKLRSLVEQLDPDEERYERRWSKGGQKAQQAAS